MVPTKDGVNKFATIVRYISRLLHVNGRVEIIIYFDQSAFIQLGGMSSELSPIEFRVANYRRHPAYNGLVGPEEIQK